MTHDNSDQLRRMLDEISSGGALTQRALARRVGAALGLTNRLLRNLVERGLVAIEGDGSRVRYTLTSAGNDERARMSRQHLHHALTVYSEARLKIRTRLGEIAALYAPAFSDATRVVFYGSGEAAEIGLSCAAEMGVRLVGVVDEDADGQVLAGLTVHSPRQLTRTTLAGEPFDCVLVTSLFEVDAICVRLEAIGLTRDRVCCL